MADKFIYVHNAETNEKLKLKLIDNGDDTYSYSQKQGSTADKSNQKTTLTNTDETVIITAEAAKYHDLYGLIIANTSATAVNVTVKDDTAGNSLPVISVPGNDTRGFIISSDDAIEQPTVNKPWTATLSGAVNSIHILALFTKRSS